MSTLTFRPFPTRTGSRSARPRTLKRTTPVCYHLVWVAPLILLILGICMLLSISMTGQVNSGSGSTGKGAYSGLAQQGTVAAIGLVVVLVLSRLDYRKLRKLSLVLLGLVAVSLILVHIPGLGHKVRGATSYIGIGPFSIQPSEYAKLALVLAGAHLMSPPQMKDRRGCCWA
jgi:cell division protein FtsW